jgi:hypothetical protein
LKKICHDKVKDSLSENEKEQKIDHVYAGQLELIYILTY